MKLNELDKKIIGLYACGMSVRDIQSEMEELYGIDVSPSMISKITDKVVEAAAEWQSRELDKIYPIVQTAKKITIFIYHENYGEMDLSKPKLGVYFRTAYNYVWRKDT